MGIWKTYRSFSAAVQWLLGLSFVLGCAALAVGIRIDVIRPTWWANLSFTQNVAASLTGFLIGVPVALTGLAAFTADREHRMELARVNSVSHSAWVRFRDAVGEFCNQSRVHGLTRLALEHYDNKTAIALFLEESHKQRIDSMISGGIGLQNFETQYSELCHTFKHSNYKVFQAIGSGSEIESSWRKVKATWSDLDTYVRTQRSNIHLQWFSDAIDADFREKLSEGKNPMADFVHLHEYDAGSGRVTTMQEFVRNLDVYRHPPIDDDKFGEWLLLASITFSTDTCSDYVGHARNALSEINKLSIGVLQVETQNWPASCVQPVL